MNHQSKDTHLSGTTVVELDRALLQLGLLTKLVPSKVDESVAEVTDKLVSSSFDTFHDTNLEETNEAHNLKDSELIDVVKGGKTVANVGESSARVVDIAGETNTGLLGQVSNNGKHGNAAMFYLGVSKTVKRLLITVSNKAERIEKSQRGLGTELLLERHVHGDRGPRSLLRRSESSGSGNERCGNDSLHGDD